MAKGSACCQSTPLPLTRSLASVSAPSDKSFPSNAAWPPHAAKCSSVCPSCAARGTTQVQNLGSYKLRRLSAAKVISAMKPKVQHTFVRLCVHWLYHDIAPQEGGTAQGCTLIQGHPFCSHFLATKITIQSDIISNIEAIM